MKEWCNKNVKKLQIYKKDYSNSTQVQDWYD